MITVQCGHCQKTFTFDPATAIKNAVEHMSEDSRNTSYVEYRVICTHCSKRNTYLFEEDS